MNGPDSILDPVTCRIRYTRSYSLARGSAPTRLDSTKLCSWLMRLHVGPTVLTCQLTRRWHNMPTLHADAMMTSSLSGSVIWAGSSDIRVGSAHPAEEDAWGTSVRMDSHLVGACSHVWLLILTLFSPVCSSLPPLRWYGQNIILTTLIFEQKSNTALNHMLWYQLLGIQDGWYTDNCPLEAKHTDTIFNVIRQIAYIHGRSQYY
jgi:hypothetical protein